MIAKCDNGLLEWLKGSRSPELFRSLEGRKGGSSI